MKQIVVVGMLAVAICSQAAVAGRLHGLASEIDDFLGNSAVLKASDENRWVAQGVNGNQVRFDFGGHGYPPHAHLEVPNPNGKGHIDAPGTDHHLYFKQD